METKQDFNLNVIFSNKNGFRDVRNALEFLKQNLEENLRLCSILIEFLNGYLAAK